MKARSILERVLLISLMTVPLWAAGAGRASAQACGGDFPPCPPPPVPPHCVSTDSPVILADPPVPLNCMVVAATFTPENNSWTYFFDPNNSIKITTKVNFPFELVVDLIPHTQAAYQARVVSTPFEGSTCNPTIPGDPLLDEVCAVYKVHGELVPPGAYGNGIENLLVEYLLGWMVPPIVGNKHDLMLLRAPGQRFTGDTMYGVPFLFTEEITTKIVKHYTVGADPGAGGGAGGFSDYVVAHQRVRPVSIPK